MKSRKQEEICTITVVDDAQERKQIIVCQDSVSYYKKDNNHKKTFHLDSFDGPEVFTTNDPNIFKLSTGELLRKKSH